jgi:MoxR-like ATPase
MMEYPADYIRTDLSSLQVAVTAVRAEMAKVIVGQTEMIDLLIVGLLADGHILIEGVPGVAKTLTAKLLARTLDLGFSRIQFTPDLMPSDILGTSVFNPQNGSFQFKKGPIFSSIILIDEINRSPAKTQAALFEVMEEKQVTIDGITFPMAVPFLVLATQNPVEMEGVYRLPEAQLDRFLFKIAIKYPSLEEEIRILQFTHEGKTTHFSEVIKTVMSAGDIESCRALIQGLYVEPKVMEYIAKIIHDTRGHPALYLGASPRASVALLKGSKAFAAMQGRDFVTPDDVVIMAPAVLRHRIILTPQKEMEGETADEVIGNIIKKIEVPR